jgi:hypothetical protein
MLMGAEAAAIALAAILAFAVWGLPRLFAKRQHLTPRRARPKLRVVEGARNPAYDLASDDRTDSQRYLM